MEIAIGKDHRNRIENMNLGGRQYLTVRLCLGNLRANESKGSMKKEVKKVEIVNRGT